MRLMRLAVGVVAILLVNIPAAAQQLPDYDGSFKPVLRGRTWTVPKRFGKDGVRALTFVDPSRLVVAIQGPPGGEELEGFTLSFYNRKAGALVETHRFATTHLLLGLYRNTQGDRIITTWETGGSYRMGIFSWERSTGEVRLVLWLGWKSYSPELVNETDTVIYPVPIHTGPGALPEKAEIYQWVGGEYKLARVVPWLERHMLR